MPVLALRVLAERLEHSEERTGAAARSPWPFESLAFDQDASYPGGYRGREGPSRR